MTLLFERVMNLVDENQTGVLHNEGFKETCEVIIDFIERSREDLQHWVCNSAPGHGKTTALTKIVQSMSEEKWVTPLLLVFNNSDNLMTFYGEIVNHCNKIGRKNFIRYVDVNNFENVIEDLEDYPVICIMHQRLRNLAVDISNKENYLRYRLSSGQCLQRSLIIDEMPNFLNDCTFDISSNNNSVDWFDDIAAANNLNPEEVQTGRNLIMTLVSLEMRSNIGNTTLRLKRLIEGSQIEIDFNSILSKLKAEGISNETFIKYNWFKKLLYEDNVGVIDRHQKGSQIICAERIDYRKLGNVLILDGTSYVTKRLYNNEYEFKNVKNYHRYSDRLFLHFRDINTSSARRKDLTITGAISKDIKEIRATSPIIPLMNKDCVDIYIKNGGIAEDQKKFFVDSRDVDIDADMPLNLLNTVGKNILNSYNSLALLNLPIRNPLYYKKIAISLKGTKIDLSMAKGNNKSSWFNDRQVQEIFEEVMTADLLQIIHRTNLRNINDETNIQIFIYTNRNEWSTKLRETLNLSAANLSYNKLDDNYYAKFILDCEKWALDTKQYLKIHHKDTDALLVSTSSTALQIGGRKFKDWLNTNWNIEGRRADMIEIFQNEGIEVFVNQKSYKSFTLIEDELK